MIDESVDERLQNSRRPEVDDSDESANFEKTLLADRSMTNRVGTTRFQVLKLLGHRGYVKFSFWDNVEKI